MSVVLTGPTLPPEVWSHILKLIPKSNLPQLLGVCSLFHDIVLRFLFSSIKIFFIGAIRGCKMLNTPNQEWIEEISRNLMSKSWEILNHICQEPRFAKVVRRVTIVAFGDGLSLFEQRKLTVANTLLFIPNLQGFRWIGTGPDFDGTVAECLPSTLRKLVVQSSFPLHSLQHLKQLEILHLSMPWFFPDDEEAHDSWTLDEELLELHHRQPTIESIIEQTSWQLKSLRIAASQVGGIPVRILINLVELEIIWAMGDEIVGLDLVFHHATSLRSLTMVGFVVHDLFLSFPSPSSSDILPHLTSFRLLCERNALDADDGYIDFLCQFLRNRKCLRRLYLRIPLFTWPESQELWNTVDTLSGLEVLGIHIGTFDLREEELQISLAKLPSKLRALHLAFDCETSSLLLLVDAIGKLPFLTFLHLYGTVRRLPVLLEDLIIEAKGLQMIGLNRALWDIERVGTNVVTNKWPRWKIKFCTEDDFLCEDDAWLFQYN